MTDSNQSAELRTICELIAKAKRLLEQAEMLRLRMDEATESLVKPAA